MNNLQERDRSRVIFEKGCLQSGEEWAEKNLLPLAGVVLAVAFAQVRHIIHWNIRGVKGILIPANFVMKDNSEFYISQILINKWICTVIIEKGPAL